MRAAKNGTRILLWTGQEARDRAGAALADVRVWHATARQNSIKTACMGIDSCLIDIISDIRPPETMISIVEWLGAHEGHRSGFHSTHAGNL